MAEIEQRATAFFGGFAFISGHHLRLDFAAAFDRVGQRSGVAAVERVDVGLQPIKKCGVESDAVFDHFSETGSILTIRQRFQCVGIGEHQQRLIKSADHVFAARVIDRGLAADT